MNHSFPFLRVISGTLLVSFGGVILAWLACYTYNLFWCLCIWRSKQLFIDCFWQVKTFFSRVPWLMGLPLDCDHAWLELLWGCHWVCGAIHGWWACCYRLRLCRSYLVPWWIGLTLIHCLVGCCWDKVLLQCPQLGSRKWACYQMYRWMWLPSGPCGEEGALVWWLDLSLDGQDWLWNIAERAWNWAPERFSGSEKIEVCRPDSGSTDGHVSYQVPWWTRLRSNVGRELGLFLDLLKCRHECLPPGPCASSTAVDWLRESGAEYQALWVSSAAQLGM